MSKNNHHQTIKNIVGETVIECALTLMEELPKNLSEYVLLAAKDVLQDGIRFDYNFNRKSSWGGRRNNKGFMSLALARYNEFGSYTFKEYRSFEKDPEIGTISFRCWKDKLRCLVAHEFTHVVQYTLCAARDKNNDFILPEDERKEMRKPHGDGFKNMYRILRKKLINHKVVMIEDVYQELKAAGF